jgi:hypothetical protein
MSLTNATVASEARIRDLPITLFPFDRDVLSLHRPAAFKEVIVDGSLSILHETAQVCWLAPLSTH